MKKPSILPQFKALLAAMDEEAGGQLHSNDIEEIAPNVFYYSFDALVDCTVTFNRDGTVSELLDGWTKEYKSILEWAEDTITASA